MNLKLSCIFILSVGCSLFAAGQSQFVAAEELPTKCGLPHVLETMRASEIQGKRIDLRTLFQRQERQKMITAGNVRVHYDTSGADAAFMLDASHQRIPGTADQFADSVLAIANVVWNFETGLGYLAPPSDQGAGGGPEYDIYVSDLGNLYGQTFTETQLDNKPDGNRYTTYIEIDNDFVFVSPPTNRGLPALRVTLAHELHHAIQLGSYGLWEDDIFYYEITSVWMEDVVFTDVNDYVQYLYSTHSQFSTPEVPLDSNDQIMYSRAVWNHYVSKRFSRDAILRSWERIQDVPPLYAIDLALQEQPYLSSFRKAFSEWSVWNYLTGSRNDTAYYPEGANYPLITENMHQFVSPADTIAGALLPLGTTYQTILSGGAPLTLAIPNVDFDHAVPIMTASYSFYLNISRVDDQYFPTPLPGIYVKRDVQDPYDWGTWAIVNGYAAELAPPIPVVAAGPPFPNPFFPDGSNIVSIPVETSYPVPCELHIFSDDMDLVFSGTMDSHKDQQERWVIQWNGKRDNGETVQSGVYLFYISLPDQTLKGKIALIAK